MLHVVSCPRCPLGYYLDGHVVPEHRPLHQVVVGPPGSIPDVITLSAGPLCKGSNAFICPRCGKPSWHPGDAEHGYCGNCHWWTGDSTLGAPEILGEVLELRAHVGLISEEPVVVPTVVTDVKGGWFTATPLHRSRTF